MLKKALEESGKKNCFVSSAGIGALVGHKPDPIAIQLMQDKGVDISNYCGVQLNQTLIRKSDLILVMESGHKTYIENKEASAKGKVFKLGEWGGFEVPDPYKKEKKEFVDALQLIEKGVMEWLKRI
ncbi:MAG: low molecular weight phosphotyrosine protein phosphatase [Methylococcaceae bacterium]|nr:low molecular weight phosphotyrosine protein phosphatase [Methylococcaceae bacterium]